MKRIGQILGLFAAILIAVNCFSQQVIATAGSSGTGSGIQLSWTIGEPVTATTQGSDFYMTQGFHQSQPVTAMFSQEISLLTGWNILSVRVIPPNKNVADIFQPLIEDGILKKVMDETGKTMEDWGVYGGWQNEIGNLISTEGYKVNVDIPATLSVTGTTFLFAFQIKLNAGWNIISWPSPNEQDGLEVFETLINEGKLIKVMDENGWVIENWGIYGDWQNFIGNVKPGEGYKVNVTEDCILTINEFGTKSDGIIAEYLPSAHFIPAFKGNGTDHMNINLLNLTESGIMEGDEIGVFDGGICVGSTKIFNNNSTLINNQFSVSIPVSAADGIEMNNGYSVGNLISVKLYRNGKEYPLAIESLGSSQTVFSKGSSLFAQLALPTGIEGAIKGGFSDVKVYPNPFSDVVNVEINLGEEAKVQVEVLNQLGQKVKFIMANQIMPVGLHKLTWNGSNENNSQVSAGIYHLRIEIDNSVILKKVVLSN